MTDTPQTTIVIDCATGAIQERPLTADEAAQLQTDQVAGVAAAQVVTTQAANRQTMTDRATQAIANLNAAAAALAAGTATAAQQRQALELCCRTCARLVRLVLDELDTAD